MNNTLLNRIKKDAEEWTMTPLAFLQSHNYNIETLQAFENAFSEYLKRKFGKATSCISLSERVEIALSAISLMRKLTPSQKQEISKILLEYRENCKK